MQIQWWGHSTLPCCFEKFEPSYTQRRWGHKNKRVLMLSQPTSHLVEVPLPNIFIRN